MALETMTKLATYTVGAGGVSSYTFSNIPQSYTDLKLVGSVRTNRSATFEDALRIEFNGVGGTSYSNRRLYGNGATASSDSDSSAAYSLFYSLSTDNNTASVFGSFEMYVPNYSGNSYKVISTDVVSENNGTNAIAGLHTGLWSNSAPITQIKISPNSGTLLNQYSTFTLYGVKAMRTAVGNSIKATGGVLSFDGTYVTHTFTSTGTFTPTQSLTADYLVVAGGGGGGSSNSVGSRGGGGGGAGGYRTFSSQSLTARAYTVTVGAGGASNTQGADSSFNYASSTGGGRGGTSDVGGANSGGSGGSGGSAGQHPGTRNGGAGNAGSYSPVEGYAGTAITTDESPYDGAPGGGSSGTASYTNPSSGVPANGTANSISGSSVTYAVGGRGGLGAGEATVGTAGTANTGNGGQGGSGKSAPYAVTAGGAGGSGIVIIRYKA